MHTSCSGMDYMHTIYNTTTTKIATNLINARKWTNSVIDSVRLRLYALLQITNLKTITGLDENKLDTYTVNELDQAKDQIGKMITYSGEVPKLDALYSKLQGKIQSIEDAAEQERINQEIEDAYDPEEAAKEVELLLKQQRMSRK